MNRPTFALLCAAALAACRDSSGVRGAASLLISPILDSVYVGDQLPPHQVTYLDANGNPQPAGQVVWGSTDPSIVQIDPMSGVVTGLKRGSVLITARAQGVAAGVLVTVSDTLDITLLLDTIYVMPGDTLTVPVVVLRRDAPPAPTVSFEAPSNPAFSIDASGKITVLATAPTSGPFRYIVHANAIADTGAVYVLSLTDTIGGKFFYSVGGSVVGHVGGPVRATNYTRTNGKQAFQLRGTFTSGGFTHQIVQITLRDSVIVDATTYAIDSLNPSEDNLTVNDPIVICSPPRPWALWHAPTAGLTAYSRPGGELVVTQIVTVPHGQAMSGTFTFTAKRTDYFTDPLALLSIRGSFVAPLVTNLTSCGR